MKRLLLGFALLLCHAAALADPIWIDVRGAEEHAADHIDGDVHVPLAELDPEALAEKYGKDAEIMLYCRSGNRAGQALEQLKAAGFTDLTNAGGITAVRNMRGLAEQSPAPAPASSTPLQ